MSVAGNGTAPRRGIARAGDSYLGNQALQRCCVVPASATLRRDDVLGWLQLPLCVVLTLRNYLGLPKGELRNPTLEAPLPSGGRRVRGRLNHKTLIPSLQPASQVGVGLQG